MDSGDRSRWDNLAMPLLFLLSQSTNAFQILIETLLGVCVTDESKQSRDKRASFLVRCRVCDAARNRSIIDRAWHSKIIRCSSGRRRAFLFPLGVDSNRARACRKVELVWVKTGTWLLR